MLLVGHFLFITVFLRTLFPQPHCLWADGTWARPTTCLHTCRHLQREGAHWQILGPCITSTYCFLFRLGRIAEGSCSKAQKGKKWGNKAAKLHKAEPEQHKGGMQTAPKGKRPLGVGAAPPQPGPTPGHLASNEAVQLKCIVYGFFGHYF